MPAVLEHREQVLGLRQQLQLRDLIGVLPDVFAARASAASDPSSSAARSESSRRRRTERPARKSSACIRPSALASTASSAPADCDRRSTSALRRCRRRARRRCSPRSNCASLGDDELVRQFERAAGWRAIVAERQARRRHRRRRCPSACRSRYGSPATTARQIEGQAQMARGSSCVGMPLGGRPARHMAVPLDVMLAVLRSYAIC